MREYLIVIFCGIMAVFLYNYFSCLLRAIGNSVTPLLFLAVSAVLNIALDLWFVLGLHRGVAGAAEATVISQYVSGIGIAVYSWFSCPWLRIGKEHRRIRRSCLKEIAGFSVLTCPAVRHESRHPDGAGPCQQLWYNGDGGICGRCEDRFLCLYAGTGLWQRLLLLYCPEFRRRKEGPDSDRI